MYLDIDAELPLTWESVPVSVPDVGSSHGDIHRHEENVQALSSKASAVRRVNSVGSAPQRLKENEDPETFRSHETRARSKSPSPKYLVYIAMVLLPLVLALFLALVHTPHCLSRAAGAGARPVLEPIFL